MKCLFVLNIIFAASFVSANNFDREVMVSELVEARVSLCSKHFNIEPYIQAALSADEEAEVPPSIHSDLQKFYETGDLGAPDPNLPMSLSCAQFVKGFISGGFGFKSFKKWNSTLVEQEKLAVVVRQQRTTCEPYFPISPYLQIFLTNNLGSVEASGVQPEIHSFLLTGRLPREGFAPGADEAHSCATFAEGYMSGALLHQLIYEILKSLGEPQEDY